MTAPLKDPVTAFRLQQRNEKKKKFRKTYQLTHDQILNERFLLKVLRNAYYADLAEDFFKS